jgi:hypothetical protein
MDWVIRCAECRTTDRGDRICVMVRGYVDPDGAIAVGARYGTMIVTGRALSDAIVDFRVVAEDDLARQLGGLGHVQWFCMRADCVRDRSRRATSRHPWPRLIPALRSARP